MNDKVKEAIINLNYLVECRCDEAYTGRGRHDPHSACDYAEEMKIVADHVAAIEDKLTKAEARAEEWHKVALGQWELADSTAMRILKAERDAALAEVSRILSQEKQND